MEEENLSKKIRIATFWKICFKASESEDRRSRVEVTDFFLKSKYFLKDYFFFQW